VRAIRAAIKPCASNDVLLHGKIPPLRTVNISPYQRCDRSRAAGETIEDPLRTHS
jgi:hypothetical protein